MGKDLLSKFNSDPHVLTRCVVVPAEWGLEKDKVDAVHNMFKQASEVSLYAQRATTEKFPPDVFDGLDVAQLGTVKWQFDGSCHIAMSHYSSVAEFIEFMAVNIDVDLRWSKMCFVEGKVRFGECL